MTKNKNLPPTTRHDSIISSASCIGPILVLFSCRPHLSSTTGDSGKTTFIIITYDEEEKGEIEMKRKENEKMFLYMFI